VNGPLLLTGANGRTGRAIIASLARAGIAVRAFIRDEAQAAGLMALGASEYVVGDMADAASLKAAARGAAKILHVGPPMHPVELEFMDAVIDAARTNDVGHVIYYSVMHPLSRAIRHHRLKLDAEERLIDSGLAHTILQPSRYMQHLEPIWPIVVKDGVHAMPFSIERRFSVVDLRDLADACAVVAGTDAYQFGTYELAGPEALSQQDMAGMIAEVIGRPVQARAVPIAEMLEKASKAGANEDRLEQMEIMNSHYDRHGFRSNAVTLEHMLGRPATRFRDYVNRLAREKGTIS
jgi:uncharacterized protein YbjT (DUF2867 family)